MLLIGWTSWDSFFFLWHLLWVQSVKLWTCFSFLWGFTRGDRCFILFPQLVVAAAAAHTYIHSSPGQAEALRSNTIGSLRLLSPCWVLDLSGKRLTWGHLVKYPAQPGSQRSSDIGGANGIIISPVSPASYIRGLLCDTFELHKSGCFYVYFT